MLHENYGTKKDTIRDLRRVIRKHGDYVSISGVVVMTTEDGESLVWVGVGPNVDEFFSIAHDLERASDDAQDMADNAGNN
jgi:hypothetical protein